MRLSIPGNQSIDRDIVEKPPNPRRAQVQDCRSRGYQSLSAADAMGRYGKQTVGSS